MLMALTSKSKLGFVDESMSSPATSPLFHSLTRCNIIVFSWLLNSLIKEIVANVIYVDSIMEM